MQLSTSWFACSLQCHADISCQIGTQSAFGYAVYADVEIITVTSSGHNGVAKSCVACRLFCTYIYWADFCARCCCCTNSLKQAESLCVAERPTSSVFSCAGPRELRMSEMQRLAAITKTSPPCLSRCASHVGTGCTAQTMLKAHSNALIHAYWTWPAFCF